MLYFPENFQVAELFLGVGWFAKLVGLSPVVARNIIKLILREIDVFVFIHGDVEQLAAPAMV